jgi:DNA recombination protein RmuC
MMIPVWVFGVIGVVSTIVAILAFLLGQKTGASAAGKPVVDLEARLVAAQADTARLNDAIATANNDRIEAECRVRGELERRATLEERVSRIATLESELSASRQAVETLRKEFGDGQTEVAAIRMAREAAQTESRRNAADAAEQKSLLDSLRIKHEDLATRLAESNAKLQSAQDLLAGTQAMREQMSQQFQNLANEILEDKSRRFAEQNQTNLTNLLDPLRERIKEFQKKVEDTYSNESRERASLQTEIQRLAELNRQMTEDATNLTNALKGNKKTQGTWGEFVLESVLEASGLREGHEFARQENHSDGDGGRLQPDIIINLPEGKHMVVDSKVSLVAYERFSRLDPGEERDGELRQHVNSIRAHVKRLGDKNYQSLYSLKSLDFVLMFIPIESAFLDAVNADQGLYMEAWNRNVILVSPSTLLATLSTIASIWRREHQNQNAQEIARHCASLYDKFVGFVEDLEDVGKKLAAAQKSYDTATTKLSTGRGNLLRQVERVRTLGVKPNKQLSGPLLDAALNDGEDDEVAENAATIDA